MIKKLLALGLLLGILQTAGVVRLWGPSLAPSLKKQNGESPEKLRGDAGRGSVRHTSYEKLLADGFDLPDLAVSGAFTIVDFTSVTCPTCIALEPAYERLVRKRPDVTVVRMNLPTQFGGFQTNDPQEAARLLEEMKQRADRFEAALGRFDFCGTPHIAVLDPKKKVFRGDTCRNKRGFDFVKSWLREESIDW